MERQALFGSRMRSIRKSASLSREAVAERAGISANYLGEIERGEKWPTLDMIERIAKALAITELTAENVDGDIYLHGRRGNR